MILKVELHLLPKRFSGGRGKKVGTQYFRGDVERAHDCILFIRFGPVEKVRRNIWT